MCLYPIGVAVVRLALVYLCSIGIAVVGLTNGVFVSD